MPISVLCGACQAKLNAPDAAAGKRVKCPKCGTALQIPKPVLLEDDEDDRPTLRKPLK